jgi:hypothetical protein
MSKAADAIAILFAHGGLSRRYLITSLAPASSGGVSCGA